MLTGASRGAESPDDVRQKIPGGSKTLGTAPTTIAGSRNPSHAPFRAYARVFRMCSPSMLDSAMAAMHCTDVGGCVDFLSPSYGASTSSLRERARKNCKRAEASAAAETVAAPWAFLAERHTILETECKRRCECMADMSRAEFLAPLGSSLQPSAEFVKSLPSLQPIMDAALRDSEVLWGLHDRLVPSVCSEPTFWHCSFAHIRAARASVLPPGVAVVRSASEERREADDEFERFLASPLQPPPPGACGARELVQR